MLFSTAVICAAPVTLPQIRKLSFIELMASVANGVDSESERSTALWWIFEINMDEPGFEESEPGL